ncbi:MAG: hypothetical protein DMG88_00830 [Acidobacteria bacterium]|nr:MAG: hypothetical protein DMG88_00830 [Acidobacteriota bacterium]
MPSSEHLRVRMHLIWQTFAVAFVLLPLVSTSTAQEPHDHQRAEDLLGATDSTKQYIETIRPYLFGNLPTSEMAIYQKISFRVTTVEAPWKATSGKEYGTRVVEVDEGAQRQMEILSAALIIEIMQNREVLIPYLRYVAMSMNNKAGFIKDVTTFAHVDPNEIDGNSVLHHQHIAMTVNGMAFLLAHEVGHHVLGHYDRPTTKDPVALRQMELDADSWALKRCVNAKPHFSPLGGMLPLLFAYYTTPHPIAREKSADHPAAVRRIRAMFEAMQAALPDFREDIIKQGGSYDQFGEFINRTIATYSREIDEDRTPVQELPTIRSAASSKSPAADEVDNDDGNRRSRRRTAANEEDDDDSERGNRRRRSRLGGFCGDVYGRRYCPMVQAMRIGSPCTCSNLPGWGVVVP